MDVTDPRPETVREGIIAGLRALAGIVFAIVVVVVGPVAFLSATVAIADRLNSSVGWPIPVSYLVSVLWLSLLAAGVWSGIRLRRRKAYSRPAPLQD